MLCLFCDVSCIDCKLQLFPIRVVHVHAQVQSFIRFSPNEARDPHWTCIKCCGGVWILAFVLSGMRAGKLCFMSCRQLTLKHLKEERRLARPDLMNSSSFSGLSNPIPGPSSLPCLSDVISKINSTLLPHTSSSRGSYWPLCHHYWALGTAWIH